MPNSVTIAADVDEVLDAELAELSRTTGRAKALLVEEALRSYVVSEKRFIEAVQAGIADLEAGRLMEHDTVVAAVDRIIRSAR
jgi:predicted transcriptional regulator